MTKAEAKLVKAGDPRAVRIAERVLASARRVAVKRAPRRKEKRASEAAERANRAEVYARVDNRSGGQCEVTAQGQRCWNTASEHDHFWGRGKAEESYDNVWHLCKKHHDRKTLNAPERRHWLKLFGNHCLAWRLYGELAKVDRALALESAQHPEANR